MREIKFRAWSPWYKKMCFYDLSSPHKRGKGHPLIITLHTEQRRSLMQYTGLKDKNGVEIYEGDIVRLHIKDIQSGDPAGGLTTIDNRWAVEYDLRKCGYGNALSRSEWIEVIGNIYEHSHLLGGSNE